MNVYELDNVLSLIADEVGPEVQVQTVRTLLFIAMRGSCNQKDIEIELCFTNASASRNVAYWTDVKADRKDGMRFVIRTEDPHDRRYKILTLSKKGRDFIERMVKHGKATRNKMAG
jgi:DNA-binding MarR family transcriptional regulator